MGDLPPASRPQAMDNATTSFARDGNTSLSTPLKATDASSPFHSQLSALPQGQFRHDHRSPAYSAGHYQSQEHNASSLSMATMAGMLPDLSASDDASLSAPTVPRSLSGASTSAVAYQLGHSLQTPGNMPSHSPYGPGYTVGLHQQPFMPQHGSPYSAYHAFPTSHSRPAAAVPMQAPYQNYQQPSHYMYYPAPYGPQGHFNPGFAAQASQNPTMYGRRPSFSNTGPRMPPASHQPDSSSLPLAYGTQLTSSSGTAHSTPISSIPRGPPRKPKQSGHALWVGNLPPGTTVVALKDHFSRDATKDIESLFLISKSNCAFVNYRTEESCTAAMYRFHDSRFNGVRLVCRLRRSSAPASGVPTAPSAMMDQQKHTSRPATPAQENTPDDLAGRAVESPVQKGASGEKPSPEVASKYFIVKSLTLQDLELSVRNGIWATQSHNEDILNKAFRAAENVYLIFSANKSGEYFGYARMASPILDDGSRMTGSAPKPEVVVDTSDVPKSIPTAATEWAPPGKIIDDSARGTIFWEAELSDAEKEDGEEKEKESSRTEKDKASQPPVDGDAAVIAQGWGKPFKIEWISTNRLPFYRARGLRNPWNANREVKIARDGTELEPSVGERLVQMFHRLGPSTAGAPVMPVGPSGIAPHMRAF